MTNQIENGFQPFSAWVYLFDTKTDKHDSMMELHKKAGRLSIGNKNCTANCTILGL